MLDKEVKDILFNYLNEAKETMSPEAKALFEVTVELEAVLDRRDELMDTILPIIKELREIEDKIEVLQTKGNTLEKAITDKW